MKNSYSKSDPVRILIGIAAFMIVVAGIRSVAPIINQLLLAIIIALTLSPLITWLMSKGRSHTTSVIITVLVAVIGGLALAGMFGVALAGLIKQLPQYTSQFTELKASFEQYLNDMRIDSSIVMGAAPDPSEIVNISTQILSSISSALGTTLIVLVIAALMLAEAPQLTQTLVSLSPGATNFMQKAYKIRTEVMRYLSMLGLMNLMIAAGNTIVFFILGVDYAIVWGVLSFFLAFVPYVGFILYAVAPMLVLLIEAGWIKAIILIGLLFAINFVVDNVIKPIFMKGGFNISFLVIMLSFIFWGYIFGAIGFILAVPLTMTAKILLLDEEPDVDVRLPGEEDYDSRKVGNV
ncbi:MAG: AI-2E family transporter [Chitinophagales bacterium]|nr:AI-2E family transporter [Chitinophagales bacterium]